MNDERAHPEAPTCGQIGKHEFVELVHSASREVTGQ